MDTRFAGSVAVITGAAGGIGRATAVRLASEGAAVAVLDVDPEGLSETVGIIEEGGGRALASTCDVSNPALVRESFESIDSEFGLPNVLFNNAGIAGPSVSTPDTSVDGWNECIAVNLTGVFLVAAEFLRRLTESGLPGALVHTSSVDAVFAEPYQAAYIASKGGVIALSRMIAVDHGKQGIRSNVICPGHVMTEMTRPYYEPVGAIEQVSAGHALGRIGLPDEIASTVAFLCSGDASFITGATIMVDGGMSAGAQLMPESDVYKTGS